MIEALLSLIFQFIIGPWIMAHEKKKDEDPQYARAADVAFSEWSASSTTEERRKALKDLYVLQNS